VTETGDQVLVNLIGPINTHAIEFQQFEVIIETSNSCGAYLCIKHFDIATNIAGTPDFPHFVLRYSPIDLPFSPKYDVTT